MAITILFVISIICQLYGGYAKYRDPFVSEIWGLGIVATILAVLCFHLWG